jgi:hypothetical protein
VSPLGRVIDMPEQPGTSLPHIARGPLPECSKVVLQKTTVNILRRRMMLAHWPVPLQRRWVSALGTKAAAAFR